MNAGKTKELLLEVGLDQVSIRGVSGLTLGQLATAAGMSKSGLFAHFRSKEQLQIELMDMTARVAARVVVEPAKQVEDGLPRLIATMDNWLGWSRRAGLSGGCPMAAVFFELDDVESEVRSHAAKLAEEWRKHLGEIVLAAKLLGHLNQEADVEQIVWDLCAIYLGHHMSSRFQRDSDADQRAKISFDALIQRYRPTSQDVSQTRAGSDER